MMYKSLVQIMYQTFLMCQIGVKKYLTLEKKDNIIQKNDKYGKREENVKICTLTHT